LKVGTHGEEDGEEWTRDDMDMGEEDDDDECSSFAAVPLSEVNAAGTISLLPTVAINPLVYLSTVE